MLRVSLFALSDSYVCVFPDSFTSTCEHSLFCSKIRENANDQRRTVRLRVANRLTNRVFARLRSFVLIPANLRAKEDTRSPGLQKSPISL